MYLKLGKIVVVVVVVVSSNGGREYVDERTGNAGGGA